MGEQYDDFEDRTTEEPEHAREQDLLPAGTDGPVVETGSAAAVQDEGRAARMTLRSAGRRAGRVPAENADAWGSDQELVHQILAGSREHFDQLYEAYFPRVYRFALKRLGDPGEAEDVAQEVFMTLMTALASFKGESTLLVWIFGVTRNKVNRRFRRPRPRLEALEEGGALDLEAAGPLADEAVDARRMLGRCEAVIENELTPLQRRIFHLKHLRRQPIRAIAQALGKSEDAVKANLYRMRRAISEGTPGLEGLLQN
ncbi:MAG: sigma-70 family RNA polymerase sigma factor [Myxococcota bacterium]